MTLGIVDGLKLNLYRVEDQSGFSSPKIFSLVRYRRVLEKRFCRKRGQGSEGQEIGLILASHVISLLMTDGLR
jgi:hypothetical protein